MAYRWRIADIVTSPPAAERLTKSSRCSGELGVPSDHYRYYCLDGAGHLHQAEWFQVEDDAAALALIASNHPDETCEIWQGKRLVGTVPPKGPKHGPDRGLPAFYNVIHRPSIKGAEFTHRKIQRRQDRSRHA